jgi:hypothetical protein
VEIWIIGAVVAAGVLFVLYNKYVRRLKGGKDEAQKDIYPLW